MGSKAPSPGRAADAQAQYNREAMLDAARVNQIQNWTPFGTERWEGEIGSPDRTRIIELAPAEQAALDRQRAIRAGLQGIAQNMMPAVSERLSTPFSVDDLPPLHTEGLPEWERPARPALAPAGNASPSQQPGVPTDPADPWSYANWEHRAQPPAVQGGIVGGPNDPMMRMPPENEGGPGYGADLPEGGAPLFYGGKPWNPTTWNLNRWTLPDQMGGGYEGAGMQDPMGRSAFSGGGSPRGSDMGGAGYGHSGSAGDDWGGGWDDDGGWDDTSGYDADDDVGDDWFMKGGYTGAGKNKRVEPHRRAGVVHEGEVVIDHPTVRRLARSRKKGGAVTIPARTAKRLFPNEEWF